MKSKRKSVSLRNCAPLTAVQIAAVPWHSSTFTDDAELAFLDVTAGLPLLVVEELRSWSNFAAMAQLIGHFDGVCKRLAGLPIAKKLLRVLHRIGPDGRERLSREGVSASDLIRALTLLLPIKAEEREGIVSACVRYGHDAAQAGLEEIAACVRDPVFLRAIGHTDESISEIARRLRMSPAAVFQREQRLREKLHGKS